MIRREFLASAIAAAGLHAKDAPARRAAPSNSPDTGYVCRIDL